MPRRGGGIARPSCNATSRAFLRPGKPAHAGEGLPEVVLSSPNEGLIVEDSTNELPIKGPTGRPRIAIDLPEKGVSRFGCN